MAQAEKPYIIVAAVDYSETGDLALTRAFELASEKPNAAVHVVNVLPAYQSGFAPDAAWSGALPSVEEAAQQLRAYVDRQAATFRGTSGGKNLGFLDRLVAHQRVEVPAEEVSQLAADLEADLVVVGTVRLAPCPVLVVRPRALPPPVPAIEPPCPRCVEARQASGGKELWCEQHRERHGQRHTYHQGDRVGADTNMPLTMR
jgi:nucleotide-binding universal stress UspA family protein